MPRVNLTATFCKTTKPGKRRTYYWDTDTKGLGFMVTPAGHKSFVFQWRQGDRDRRIKLGDYGRELTLDQARREAADKRVVVRRGGDPAAVKREQQKAWTVRNLFDYFMNGTPRPDGEEGRVGGYRHEPGKFPGTKRSLNSVREYENLWEKYILPAWGTRLARSITGHDVEALHHDISGVSLVQADRMVKVLRRPFRLARRHGQYPPHQVLPHEWMDPSRLNRAEGRPGTRYSEDELQRIGVALLGDELVGQRAGIALAFLTGMRAPHEIVRARWEDLRAEGRVLELQKTKVGPRSVFLGAKAAEIIAAQPATTEETILTSPFGGPFFDLRYQWKRIRKAAELPASRRLYDARHTFKSIAEDLGIPRWRVDLLMGHAKLGTTGRYSHPEEEGLLEDAERVCSEIWALLTARVRDDEEEDEETKLAS